MNNYIYTESLREELVDGTVYTRAELRSKFSIKDATLNTGIFKLAGANTIWLFITENKTSDRTQYVDLLKDDTLFLQGQMKGRTDHLITNHKSANNELIVFYRKHKYEYPGAAFRCEGRFVYQSHTGQYPTSFILQKTLPSTIINTHDFQPPGGGNFEPLALQMEQNKIMSSIVQRRGQAAFRDKLMNAYSKTCAVTGCNIDAVLEAAHIIPYAGSETNHVQNGVLLRADIHTLFDLHLITINPTDYTIQLSNQLDKSEYSCLIGRTISIPNDKSLQPSREALRVRLKQVSYIDR